LLLLFMAMAVCMIASSPAFAGTCPAGAKDCFLCGGADGIPCTTNCTGVFREGVGNVACECPQGEPCVCHCPVSGGAAQVKDDWSLIKDAPPCEHDDCSDRNCGEVVELRNKVAIQKDGEWCLASGGLVVKGGTKVWVPEGSKASIMLYDGARMDVNENSIFYVENLEVDEEHATAKMMFRMVKGALHFLVETDRIEQFEIRPNSAVVGIKGTEFTIEAEDSDIILKVLDGTVEFGNAGSDQVVRVGGGEYSIAQNEGGAPSVPAKFDLPGEKKWWGGSGCSAGFLLAALLSASFMTGRR